MTTCEDVRMSLGAHLMGALDAEESAQVEAHLAGCEACRAEYAELGGLTALLARVSEADIEQAASPPQAVLGRMIAASARRRRMNRLFLGLAASAAAVVVGGTAWLAGGTAPQSAQSAQSADAPAAPLLAERDGAAPAASSSARAAASTPPSGHRDATGDTLMAEPEQRAPFARTPEPSPLLKAERAGTVVLKAAEDGVRATVTMIAGGEGTTVRIALTGVATGTSCRVTAVGSDGTKAPAGSWTVDLGGPATFTGHTELPLDGIVGFDIRSSAGDRLLWVPA
ncbi:zf-HC2 domain-containing protein [Sphaerisporangium sp. TRM90804]|uniref:anti-sigma factor family protein n=1 Tax=Sphaerisporangium sp. TRM90804 TaxID=3031113 RepID=UPI00244CC906|nr:zf-HC2 domain-containing protein [Sphaerisporangium sp. TRM90804]MDH2426952.1 zf-HC2 domain-containing protein [Sphaerisporangium sp. TRM90804]